MNRVHVPAWLPMRLCFNARVMETEGADVGVHGLGAVPLALHHRRGDGLRIGRAAGEAAPGYARSWTLVHTASGQCLGSAPSLARLEHAAYLLGKFGPWWDADGARVLARARRRGLTDTERARIVVRAGLDWPADLPVALDPFAGVGAETQGAR